jgi:hypothetical protein
MAKFLATPTIFMLLKQQCLAAERQTIEVVFPLPEFYVRPLNENIAQVTYNGAVML